MAHQDIGYLAHMAPRALALGLSCRNTIKEATKLGTDDPTVQSGMLKVEMKTFWVPFHG
jgi:hypothetical protein